MNSRTKGKGLPIHNEFFIEVVEPRVMLSADVLGVDSGVVERELRLQADWNLADAVNWWGSESSDTLDRDEVSRITAPTDSGDLLSTSLKLLGGNSDSSVGHAPDSLDSILTDENQQTRYREVIFLDTGVAEGEQLLSELLRDTDSSATQVYLIDSTSDGVGQITSVLNTHQNLDAVHIISHGAAGQIQLGSGTLSSHSVESYTEQLQDWGSALADSGDILIYGCDLAVDAEGQALVDVISNITGADVAASIDQTGNAEQGGNWELEYRMGAVETAAFASYGTQSWTGVLALINVTTFNDLADGGDTSSVANLIATPGADGISLREAIIATNNDSGIADTITLSAGTYTLAIAGTGEDAAATGDLDILDPLSITGAGADQTIIDGAALDRVFQVIAGSAFNVSITDLTIRNGFVDNQGAGLHIGNVPAAPVVTLSNVWFSGNHTTGTSDYGGAIFNRGDLTIENSLIEGNSAGFGGGVMNFTDGVLNMSNSTISGNSATAGDGGGLYNLDTATLLNVTVADNSASNSGGGIHNKDAAGAITTINNTLVADNSASSNADVDGAFVSNTGDNLIEVVGSATGLHGSDILGSDPDIGILADNGGDTFTHALLSGSVAINAGNNTGAPSTDQRAIARVGTVDIGAYEFAAEVLLDSDGDGLWDIEEDANTDLDGDPSTGPAPDTDGDTVPNYLDNDDDGDGLLTSAENADPNADGNPRDAIDSDHDGQPDYLDVAATGASNGKVTGEQKISETVGGLTSLLDPNDRFGKAIDGIGDLDGDGINDMVVGAMLDDDGGTNRGAVYILFLNADGTVKAEQKISAVSGGLTAIIDDGDQFGKSVVGIGDVDGDGVIDLAIGAHNDDDGGTGRGAVHILFMNADGTVKAEQKISMTTGGLTTTLDDSDFFGAAVASLGDVDGDGINDIAVGAPRGDDGGLDRGAVHILFLNADGTVKAEQTISSTTGGLTAAIDDDDRLGNAVSGIGDLDADGVFDLAVGAQLDDDGGADRGSVHILFLNADGSVKDEQKISAVEGGLTAALVDNDRLGVTVAGIGDIDADGVTDIAVGASFDDDGGTDRGAAHILFLNPDGTVKKEQKISSIAGGLTGPLADGDAFASGLAGLGDLDGDGAIDIAVGASKDDDGGADKGAVYVLNLTATGTANNAPTATNLSTTSAYNEGDTNVAITDIVVSDVDAGETITATLTLANTATGSLSANDSATYATGTGVWTITDTVANVNTALANLVFNPATDNDLDTTISSNIDDGDEDSSGALTGTITLDVTPQNDEQVLATNIGTTVNEGSTGTLITAAMLATTDVDNTATQVVYTVTAVPGNGTVKLSGTAQVLNDTFTQDDIDTGKFTYDHDGSETIDDSFDFSVDDGAGAATTGTFSITVTAQNDEQVLVTNTGTTVMEGSTGTLISNAMLDTTDVDNTAAQVVYTVTTAPGNGALKLGGIELMLNDTFTQDDIDAGRITYNHAGDSTAPDTIGFSVDDGTGASSTGTFSITVTANDVNLSSLLFTTDKDVIGSGVPGLDSWGASAILELGNPGWGLGPGTTSGAITPVIDLGPMGLGGGGIDAIHYVGINTSIGSANAVVLEEGDLLLSVNNDSTILTSNNSLTVDDSDVFVFRPNTPGNYSQGTFTLLLDGTALPGNTSAISLVEQRTLVGDAILERGDFLLAQSDGGDNDSIWHYSASDVGLGTTSGSATLLIHGNDISIDKAIVGIDLIEIATRVGGVDLAGGQILVTVLGDDNAMGDAPTLDTKAHDIFVLDVTSTGVGTTAATATLLFEGANVNLDHGNEIVAGFALVSAPDDSDGDGLWDNEEDANIDLDNLPSTIPGPDTDGDSNPNYLDADDDGDGIPTSAERADPNADGDPRDAMDGDQDGQPDYLDLATGASDGTVIAEQKISDTVGGLAAALDPDDRFGRSVAGIGDLDGDGFNDMVVGAPRDDDGGTNRGAVYILFLDADGTVKSEQKISSLAGSLTTILDDDDRFGRSVASIGDIDGDGIRDIAVGAEGDDDGGIDRGAIYILLLNADGTVKTEQKISDIAGGLSALLDDGDSFGKSVTGIGDLDGDGINDIAVGAALDDDGGTDRGAVHILFLDADGTVRAEQKISAVAGGLTASIDDDDRFGIALSGIGDIDGDGSIDLAVGASNDDDGGTDRGAVHILNLNADGTVKAEQKLSSTSGALTGTLNDGDNFGYSVAGMGDVNDDGTGDIAVGSINDDDGGINRGAIHTLFLNPDGTVQSEQKISSTSGGFTGPLADGDQFGRSVAGLGDLDGDGAIDMAVGASYDDDGGVGRGVFYILRLNDNAAPSLTAFSGVIDTANEDTEVEISFSDLATQGDENDPDGTVDAFVVQSIATGTLKIGATAGSATAWNVGTNDSIDSSNNAYWTPDENASGTLNAFDVVARDNQGADSLGSVTATVVVTAQNDEQVLATNTGIMVTEGSTGTKIPTAMLDTTDVDNTAAQVVYTVTAVPGNGVIKLSGTALNLSDPFTQDDIDNGLLTYDHDGSETTSDGFDFSVDDGAGAATTGTFNITVTAQNDEQVLAINNGTTVNEGSAATSITAAMLATTDVDNTASQLVYTLTAVPGNGTLKLSGTALILNDAFTQDDIDNSRITYDHDGSETTSDGFDFSVDDGAGNASTGTFNITVAAQNDEQVLATNTGTTVSEGSAGTSITAAMLATTDVDNTATQLVYTVTAVPGNGVIKLSGTALTLNDTFTQDDIDNSRITYDHDGSETTSDNFNFSVDDGAGVATTGTFSITVTAQNDEQVLATNTGTTVNEGSIGTTVTVAMLDTTDVDNTAAQVVYTVTAVPGNGVIKLSGTALVLNDTFTQDDIDNSRLTYDHDGSETTSDGFDFSVDDGAGNASTGTFYITVTAQNDEQVLATNSGTTVNEGSAATSITTAMLATTDVDNTAAQVVYTVTAVPGNGVIKLSGTALVLNDTFTQDDINNSRITYDHDGSETVSDGFDISVDDGAGTATTGTFSITVTAQNDEQVLATNTGTTVNEGSTATSITTAMLATTDVDNTASQTVYTVTTVPGNGVIKLSGTALVLNDTFTQDDIDNSRITYDHDGSETTSDGFSFSVDDGAGNASTGMFSITVTAQNDEQVLATNTGTTVNEGSTATSITTAMLATTDVDNTAAQVVYTVTAVPVNGTFKLSGTALVLNDTFTQDDIDNSRLTYDHDGSETTSDGFDFSVDDGAGNASTGTFYITVTAQNDEQVLATNSGTTVNEGSAATSITTAMLATTDVDNTAAQVVYTVTAVPGNGVIKLSGTALVLNDTFTQDDIDNSRITYDHDGSETTSDGFDFSVDDGAGNASAGTFSITVTAQNDEQVLATNTGTTVNEGSTATSITAAMLATTDVDHTAAQVVYTVTAVPGNGTLKLSGTALVLNDTFTQDDIDNSRITYDHDGSETTSDGFDFSVDDGAGNASAGTFSITVTAQNDEQVLATNTGTTVNEGSTATSITAAMLATTDVDHTAAQVVYTVTAVPGNGTLKLSGTALVLNDTFTQDDIDNSRITYDHDGSETTSDGFDFSVDDGAGNASAGTFSITVTAQNDEQVLATNIGTTVNEGSTATSITAAMLATTDLDNTATQLVYTVTAVPGNGTLKLSGTALVLNDTFTQDDIDNSRLTYDHDGSETVSDGFDFSVDDGAGNATTGTYSITVTAQNDEQVLATNSGTTVNEGSTATSITAAMLATTDVDNTAAQVVYTVTAVPGNGVIKLSGTALVLNDTFTQDDINNSRLTYDHDGSETTSDGFDFSVDDGAGNASTGTFYITVTAQNDEQVLATNTGTTVNEGSTATSITTAMLATTDVDNTATQTVYTVTTVPGNGVIKLSGTALVLNDTFTQDDIDNSRITYDHDGSETTSDGFSFSVDDGAGNASTGMFSITVTAQNDEQVLATNTGTTVNEGSTATSITAAMLATTDLDNTATQLVYTVTAVPGNGVIKLSGTALVLNDTFTQDDIDNSRLTYDHDGSETVSDGFDFSVDDGAGNATTGTFNITVAAQNDEQVLATNTGTTVNEGSTATSITTAMLATTDVDNTAAQVVYTVTAVPVNGTFKLSGTALILNDTFTQDDIDNSRITYDHDGSETVSDGFDISVDDGAGTATTGTFSITVTAQNDEQVLATNAGTTVSEGSIGTTVTAAMLDTTDSDNSATEVVYTITAVPGNGVIKLSGTALTLNDTFTQDDINNSRITYDHDGSETTSDGFDFSVDDGAGTATTGTFNITVTAQNNEQVLAINNGTTVNEGSTATSITAAMLATTDVDNTATQLVYTVTAVPGNGVIKLSGTALVLNDTFTQDDIDNSRLTYDHDGSETVSDGFDFSVDDGAGTATAGTFNITITAQNDEQVLATNAGTTVSEGSTGTTVTAAMLDTTDSDNSATEVVYTITAVPGNAAIKLSGTALALNDTFTQDDIDNSRLTYDHDGSETTSDGFEFSVDDGAGTATTGTFNITVTAQNDFPALLNPITNQNVTEGIAFSFQIPENTFVDIDAGDVLTYSAMQVDGGELPTWLAFEPVTRTFTGTPPDADTGSIAIRVIAVDSSLATVDGDFTLHIAATSESPVLSENRITLGSGDTVTLTSEMLVYSAVDTNVEDLQFEVSDISGGRFELITESGIPISGFTQVQLEAGHVVFVDDGDDIAPSYSIAVNDGHAIYAPVIANVSFVVAPPMEAASAPVTNSDSQPVETLLSNSNAVSGISTEEVTLSVNQVSRSILPLNAISQIVGGTSEPEALENTDAESDVQTPDEEPQTDSGIVVRDNPMRKVSLSGTAQGTAADYMNLQSLLGQLMPGFNAANSTASIFSLDPLSQEIWTLLASNDFKESLNESNSDSDSAQLVRKAVVGSSVAVTTGLSVGYVAWMVRGGVLLSSVLSSLPAWQFIDPLPVLNYSDDEENDGDRDDSLEDIIADHSAADTDVESNDPENSEVPMNVSGRKDTRQ